MELLIAIGILIMVSGMFSAMILKGVFFILGELLAVILTVVSPKFKKLVDAEKDRQAEQLKIEQLKKETSIHKGKAF